MKPHEILGVSETTSPEEIRKAYKRLSMLHHPDRENGDHELFIRVAKAYAAIARTKCSLCQGTGKIKERSGFFTTFKDCPRCWGTEK